MSACLPGGCLPKRRAVRILPGGTCAKNAMPWLMRARQLPGEGLLGAGKCRRRRARQQAGMPCCRQAQAWFTSSWGFTLLSPAGREEGNSPPMREGGSRWRWGRVGRGEVERRRVSAHVLSGMKNKIHIQAWWHMVVGSEGEEEQAWAGAWVSGMGIASLLPRPA